jgi:energy-coupling factor transporter ATP-binding protein EcfA2
MSSSPPVTLPPSTPSSTGASPSSPPSGPTSQAASSTPSSTRPTASSTPIRWQDRTFITGDSGSGKSHLARALYLSAPPAENGRKLVIDPQHSTLLAGLPGHVDFDDPYRWPDVGRLARFTPRDPFDLDAYGALYERVLKVGRTLVLCDEAGQVAPSRGGSVPRAALTYNVVGRKRGCGHLMCHTRPVDVDPRWTAAVQHVFGFDLPLPEDRRRFAAIAGIPPAELETIMGRLPKYGFIWSNRETRAVTVCPPIPL